MNKRASIYDLIDPATDFAEKMIGSSLAQDIAKRTAIGGALGALHSRSDEDRTVMGGALKGALLANVLRYPGSGMGALAGLVAADPGRGLEGALAGSVLGTAIPEGIGLLGSSTSPTVRDIQSVISDVPGMSMVSGYIGGRLGGRDPRFHEKRFLEAAEAMSDRGQGRVAVWENSDGTFTVYKDGNAITSPSPEAAGLGKMSHAMNKRASMSDLLGTALPSNRFLHNPAGDAEGEMVRNKLHRICAMADMMKDLITDEDELPPWVQDHISTAHENIDQVLSYIQPKSEKTAVARILRRRPRLPIDPDAIRGALTTSNDVKSLLKSKEEEKTAGKLDAAKAVLGFAREAVTSPVGKKIGIGMAGGGALGALAGGSIPSAMLGAMMGGGGVGAARHYAMENRDKILRVAKKGKSPKLRAAARLIATNLLGADPRKF